MVSSIIAGISINLKATFGDGYKIYDGKTAQGIIEPCFLVKVLGVSEQPLRGIRNARTYPFDIHYFSADTGNDAELCAVGDSLIEAMRTITLVDNSVLIGTSAHYEIIDDVLHFFVNYNVMTIDAVVADDDMDTVEHETTIN